MRCAEIMKRNVECLKEMDTVKTAAARMRDTNVGFLPVCDERRVAIGTITDRDIVLRVCAEDLPHDTPVGRVMSREVIGCRPDDDVHRAEELMAAHRKSRIMVLDEQGRIEGVISLSDVAERETDQRHAARTFRSVTQRETQRR